MYRTVFTVMALIVGSTLLQVTQRYSTDLPRQLILNHSYNIRERLLIGPIPTKKKAPNIRNPYSFSRKALTRICGRDVTVMADFHTRDHFSKVHLLVILNSPFWQVVPLVDALYRPYFRRITYCSIPGNMTNAELLRNHGYDIITYHIPDPHLDPGYVAGYKCWVELVNKGSVSEDAVGVLGIADDMVISIQNLRKFNLNSIWRKIENKYHNIKTGVTCEDDSCSSDPPEWEQWAPVYLQRYVQALEKLKNRADEGQQPYRDCFRRLFTITAGGSRVFGIDTQDMYYLPRRYLEQYANIVEIFFTTKTFLESAIPAVLSCIENRTETQRIQGIDMWSEERVVLMEYYLSNPHLHYCHPIKWSALFTGVYSEWDGRLKELLCKEVVPYYSGYRSEARKSTAT